MKKLISQCILLSSLACATLLFAAEETAQIAVDSTSCANVANTTEPFILVLNTGDDFIKAITDCAKAAKLKGASISGLGQLHNPTLAYFSSNPNKKPTLKKFSGYYELASVNGNIANTDDAYYTHLHAVLADSKFRGIAGHVDQAKVGLTVELTVIPFSSYLNRAVNPKSGFGSIITK